MKFRLRSGLLSILILILVSLVTPGYAQAVVSDLDHVRSYLRENYVDIIPEETMNAPTIDEILRQLGDPFTNFMTAQEYDSFINSMNGEFSGIGIYLEMVPQGVHVTGIMDGSPAQTAGIQDGDIIIQAGSRSLAGMSSEEAVPLIKGLEGTTVDLVILRGNTTINVTVERRKIIIPTVKSSMKDNQTGLINITSFGSDTDELFGSYLNELRVQGARSYIIDLRDNGGGLVSTAQNITGYFVPYQDNDSNGVNDNLIMHLDSRIPLFSYPASMHDYVINQPCIFLLNKNTASASEILSGAVRDWNKALFVGTRSYGKGCMQTMVRLSSGNYLKITIARFTSPLSQTVIHKVGINPDLVIEENDPLQAAQLLLSGDTAATDKTGQVKVILDAKNWAIDVNEARSSENWKVFGEIMDNASLAEWSWGNGTAWQQFSSAELQEKWPLYYPSYQLLSQLTEVPTNKTFTIRFSNEVNWGTINSQTVQLINSLTGESFPLDYNHYNSSELLATARNLSPGKTYWLLINPGVKDINNKSLQHGFISTVQIK